jgi:hypothetical protein
MYYKAKIAIIFNLKFKEIYGKPVKTLSLTFALMMLKTLIYHVKIKELIRKKFLL